MAKNSGSLVRSQQKREGKKISAIVSKIFRLIVFQIDHVSLTSADGYRCDSCCLARVFQNLPAPPKHYGVFDVFCAFQSFSDLKTWDRTWQCAPMIDFYRKVNKFFERFAKCDPCLKFLPHFEEIN